MDSTRIHQQLRKLDQDELIEIVTTLRTAPSPNFALSELACQVCPVCGERELSITRYPAFKSSFFAGLLVMTCGRCGSSWVPVPNLDLEYYYKHHYAREFRSERIHTGRFFDRSNPIWARKRHPVRDRGLRHARILSKFAPIGRVLDIGCGEGFMLKALDAQEKYAYELDENVSDILIEEVGAQLITAIDREEFFDAVVASHVLEHFTYQNIRQKISEIFQSLRPGGIFLVEVPPGAQQLADFFQGARPATQRLEPHTLFFSTFSLVSLLREAGFEVLSTKICSWSKDNVDQEELGNLLTDATIRFDGPFETIVRKPGRRGS